MNQLYQYIGTCDEVKQLLSKEKFIAIIERIESVEIKEDISLDSEYLSHDDVLRARLFNEKYDITLTPKTARKINTIILTEENINGIGKKVEYIVVNVKEMTNFIGENPVNVKKYICKKAGYNIKELGENGENFLVVDEKQVFYRLIGDRLYGR